MVATIISLPTSALEPVQNPRHRGRYPSTVIPSWKVSRQRQERACRLTEAESAEMEQARATKAAQEQRWYEKGREDARMERVAIEALRSLSTVMAYLARADEDGD